jgi:hypothetical protein
MSTDKVHPVSRDALVARVRRWLWREEGKVLFVARGRVKWAGVYAYSEPWGYSWGSLENMLEWAKDHTLASPSEYIPEGWNR